MNTSVNPTIKNTFWARLFKPNTVKANKKTIENIRKSLISWDTIMSKLRNASTLSELMIVHKRAWNANYQNDNIGPCSYGYFRTKDIAKMTISEVYLGDIWGLWTHNIEWWEQNKEETMAGNGWGIDPSTTCYSLIYDQYKNHLVSNLNAIHNQFLDTAQAYCEAGY